MNSPLKFYKKPSVMGILSMNFSDQTTLHSGLLPYCRQWPKQVVKKMERTLFHKNQKITKKYTFLKLFSP